MLPHPAQGPTLKQESRGEGGGVPSGLHAPQHPRCLMKFHSTGPLFGVCFLTSDILLPSFHGKGGPAGDHHRVVDTSLSSTTTPPLGLLLLALQHHRHLTPAAAAAAVTPLSAPFCSPEVLVESVNLDAG